ncbi:MAG TPA: LapA family protein [Thermodesulforhabdus norvegica]|uniref:LapA family protein n=1 Tax=Thermodesulforhabdus norvegica TaxID=39841 RepID=A0A7C0WS59_9BACT|nr:LapA family protein [Deltaproteobacteria bacterium]MBW2069065.1 LapA family protein [Deltaproteobacteria bacterium]HDL90054.1 LapA family protein [Thermodesulforhabdus norvegica]
MIRLLKLISTFLVLGLVVLFIKQNMPTFSTDVPFFIDLHIREKVMWYNSVGGVIVMSMLFGFFVGFLLGFRMYWRKRRECIALKQSSGVVPASEQPVLTETGST